MGAKSPTSTLRDGGDGEPASSSATGRRVPDFFIVGHQKCGTTALYEMLRGHPGIFLPELKEPRFLAPDLQSRFRSRPGSAQGRREPQTLAAYLDLFMEAREDQLCGDGSPQYLRSRSAAEAILQLQPDARIVAILREPAAFVRSFHQQYVHANQETEPDLRKAVALEAPRREGKKIPRACHQPSELLYCEHARYVEQLRRFERAFGREQMLVLIYDDFRSDNLASVREVLRFLDRDEDANIEAVETKPLGAVRSMTLHTLTGAARRARRNPGATGRAGALLGALSAVPARSKALRGASRRLIYSRPDRPDAEVLGELRRRFKPEVLELSSYLGRDLAALWGYDTVS
jgi:hypothetical protein